MTSIIGPNQAVSSMVYTFAVCEACNLPHEFISANTKRITRAYTHGETVAMIAEELKMLYSIRPLHKPMKTPREMALRVVKVSS